MKTPDMRHLAHNCVSRAKALLANDDEASVRHACLELRFAIEYITYDRLQVYLAEVQDDAVRKWTPKQVIDEMLEVDPAADKTVTIAVGIEETPGIPASKMTTLGEDRRFTMKWANVNHNALGNFLHAPTLHQMGNGDAPDVSTMKRKASQIVETIESILSSPVFRVNFGKFYEFTCACGAQVKRREGSFKPEDGIVCPNSRCRAIYDIANEKTDDDQIEFQLRKAAYDCGACGSTNYIGVHRLNHGTVLVCAACGDKGRLERRFEIVRQQRSGEAE